MQKLIKRWPLLLFILVFTTALISLSIYVAKGIREQKHITERAIRVAQFNHACDSLRSRTERIYDSIVFKKSLISVDTVAARIYYSTKPKKRCPKPKTSFFGGIIKKYSFVDTSEEIGRADTIRYPQAALIEDGKPYKITQKINYVDLIGFCLETRGFSPENECLYSNTDFINGSATADELGVAIKSARDKCYERWATIGKAMIKSFDK